MIRATRDSGSSRSQNASAWFRDHVTLFDQPYTLDDDQVCAAIDQHKNTLVTARAGSGKTRVIVAKVAYLVAKCGVNLDEIVIFMFNRTAAAEVNARIAEVKIDGIPLKNLGTLKTARDAKNTSEPKALHPASTFHKFALDLVKSTGECPKIISSTERDSLIKSLLGQALDHFQLKLTPAERQEMLGLVSNFITRAGQYYPGATGLKNLESQVAAYCQNHAHHPDLAKSSDNQVPDDSNLNKNLRFHQVSFEVYSRYLAALQPPHTDFNSLMTRATEILQGQAAALLRTRSPLVRRCASSAGVASEKPEQAPLFSRIPTQVATGPAQRAALSRLRYILIDEYQDFSCLFFALTQALRHVCPAAHLFCVGDDWQAINRFAGSDVNYFINFAEFFPEDCVNIPLTTNYRSAQKIVAQANQYMLKNYNPAALPARAFSRESGKIRHLNPSKIRFDAGDLAEDSLGDGRILRALSQAASSSQTTSNSRATSDAPTPIPLKQIPPEQIPIGAAQLLKATLRILRRHPHDDIMLLHRHNFTSFAKIDLPVFTRALEILAVDEGIMRAEDFQNQVRCMTMHKSKGLEADIVILLELDRKIVQNQHPHATIFQLFGDTREAEIADQQRLIYVALTRAKRQLYLLSSDQKPLIQ